MTISKGAHLTEIRGGGSLNPPYAYTELKKSEYQFHMDGINVLKLSIPLVSKMIEQMLHDTGMSISDIDMVIPHQASTALSLMMEKLGIPKGKYVDIVKNYGNMVSASVPFALHYGIINEKIKRGDTIMMLGTAAGLTANVLVLKY